jgi:type II secretory pathway pseudopilin PulG
MRKSVSSRKGFALVHLLVVIGIIAVIAALLVPGMASGRRASNERQASTSLKTISSAEADFRANDRDGNGVNDFWTGDVKGLYTMTCAAVRGAHGDSSDPPIRLIELSVAGADADSAHLAAGGENMALRDFTRRYPRDGYWYIALLNDRSVTNDPQSRYKQDTGGSPPMGRCHHHQKFGFAALPDSPRSGKTLIWINENNSLFWRSADLQLPSGYSIPASLDEGATPCLDWPDDQQLKSCFSRR